MSNLLRKINCLDTQDKKVKKTTRSIRNQAKKLRLLVAKKQIKRFKDKKKVSAKGTAKKQLTKIVSATKKPAPLVAQKITSVLKNKKTPLGKIRKFKRAPTTKRSTVKRQ